MAASSPQRMRAYLVVIFLVVAVSFGAVIATDKKPILGLDLQGGISVVLAPVGDVRSESLDVAVEIIRSRVDSLGVAEPEISRQGDNIVVDLPGVKDRDKAIRLVGRTAELRFRPVLASVPPLSSTPTTTVAGSSPPLDESVIAAAVASCDSDQISAALTAGEIPTTKTSNDKRDNCVVLPSREQKFSRLLLGPAALTGKSVDSAKSQFSQGQGYAVTVKFNDAGATKFDALAAESYPKSPPQNEVAIVLDGKIQSAPAFQTDSFSGDVQITGDFSPSEASDLATIINYGALPVQLKRLTVQNVSPTLGQDQLDAGIAAGIIGLLLVSLYMLAFYRLLGLVVITGISLSFVFIYALVAYLGSSIGLTLTLAGVTGLIVSVGVTVDSYVVYFERLKDEVRSGRTIRSAVDVGFTRSFKTVVAADLVSLIGAAVLYFLAVGSVRGFAFFLGLSTVLDLVVAYFFMHPAVSLMARHPRLVAMRKVGIASGLDVVEVKS